LFMIYQDPILIMT